MNKYIRPKRVGDGWPPPSSPGRFSRFAIQRNDGPQARISGKKGTHAVSLAILASALRGCSCLPRLLLYFLDSKALFIAEPQLVPYDIYFALLPFLPTLTPNGGRAEDQ
jgi:hypothetical protein